MASYGTIYEFRFDDINGDDVDIFIAKKNYTGSVTRRALGRTPILKRERSGNILGTSLEIYAECRVDGEFAQLYTSSADEFRVEVYKRQNLLWRGFVSPELYSEPDIAPPYDVQIIATDGLGELKDHDYRFYGKATLRNHIQHALAPTSLQGDITLISSLSWEDDTSANAPSSLLEMVTDLSHLEEESCYDVLQSILTSLNACITQQDGGWMVIRESDLYLNASKLPAALFGSMTKAQWWPVGNMSIDIIPAKKEVSVVHENRYRENILPPISMGVAAGWEIGVGCYYSSAEGGWIVPPETGLSYRINARQYPLQSNLLLRIKARCLAIEGRDDVSKLSVYMERDYAGSTTYLIRDYSPQEDRVIMRWHDEMMGYVYAWDAPFVEQDTEPAVHDLEILVPLSGETLAESLNMVIGNPYPSPYLLCIYSIELTQAEQTPGSRLTAIIANGAREKMNESKVVLSSSANPSLPDLQYGILRLDGGVVEWHTPATTAPDLLSFAARDLAMQVALPRMRYRGKLNVPSLAYPRIPVLFNRDNTYYFLNTYSFDLLNSELEVELISIPNARVEIESETVTELPSSGSAPSSGGSTGGGTPGGGSDIVVDSVMSDISANPVQNKVVKKYVDDAETRTKKYTDDKIAQIETGGGSIAVDTEMSDTSENAVQNKVIKQYVDGIRNDLDEDIGNLAEHIDNLEYSGAVIFDVSYTANPWSNISGQVQTETTVDAISQAINNGSPIYVRFAEGIAPVEYAGVTPESTVIDLWLSFVDSEEKRSRTIRIRSHNIGWNWEAFDTDLRGNGTVDTEMSNTSTNAVQNKVIKKYTDETFAKKIIEDFDVPLTFVIADGIVGTDDEYYVIPDKAQSTTDDSQILATKADIKALQTQVQELLDRLTNAGL